MLKLINSSKFKTTLGIFVLFLSLLSVTVIVGQEGDDEEEIIPTQSDSQLPLYIWSLAWSPTGNLIAVGPRLYSAEIHDYSVRILNAYNGKIISRLQFHSADVYSVDWNSDGTKLISSGHGDAIGVVWDAVNNKRIVISQPYSMPGRLADVWNPNDSKVANVSGGSPFVNIWDPINGQTLFTFSTNNMGFPLSIAWNPNGDKLVTGNSGGNVVIWDATTGLQLMNLLGHTDDVNSVSWSSDGKRIVSGSADSTVRIWDAMTGMSINILQGHTDVVWKVQFSLTGNRIASASQDGTVRLWDAVTGYQFDIFTETAPLYAVTWSPDGTQLAFGGEGNNGEITIVTPDFSTIPTPNITPSPSRTPTITYKHHGCVGE